MRQRGNKVFRHQITRIRTNRNGFRRPLHGSCPIRSGSEDDIRPSFDDRRGNCIGSVWCYAELTHDLEVATLDEPSAPQFLE
jgi:hypothetical protein